jgi:hypothetical protein
VLNFLWAARHILEEGIAFFAGEMGKCKMARYASGYRQWIGIAMK